MIYFLFLTANYIVVDSENERLSIDISGQIDLILLLSYLNPFDDALHGLTGFKSTQKAIMVHKATPDKTTSHTRCTFRTTTKFGNLGELTKPKYNNNNNNNK